MMNFLESLGFLFLSLIAVFVVFVFGIRLPRKLEALVTIAPFIAFFFVLASIWDGISSAFVSAPTPHVTATSYRPDTITPAFGTIVPIVASTSIPDCLPWSQVTPSMEGQQKCIYGNVVSVYSTNETWTRIKFTEAPNTFFIYSTLYTYTDEITNAPLTSGDCIQVTHTVKLYGKIPYMDIGDETIYHCANR